MCETHSQAIILHFISKRFFFLWVFGRSFIMGKIGDDEEEERRQSHSIKMPKLFIDISSISRLFPHHNILDVKTIRNNFMQHVIHTSTLFVYSFNCFVYACVCLNVVSLIDFYVHFGCDKMSIRQYLRNWCVKVRRRGHHC